MTTTRHSIPVSGPVTASRLTGAAGVCAAAAGALYVAVQINHPPAALDHITTANVLIREMAKMTMAAFAILGFTGMLVRNRHRFGIFGVVSYVMVVIGCPDLCSAARKALTLFLALCSKFELLGGESVAAACIRFQTHASHPYSHE